MFKRRRTRNPLTTMATKKSNKPARVQPGGTSVLKATAEAIGSAIGTIAVKSGLVRPTKPTKAAARRKAVLREGNKQRPPRKAKKTQKNAKT